MKRLIVTLLLLVIISSSNVFTQTNPDNTQKMYYLCKVWGYLKYFHSEVAKGTLNWDSLLVLSVSEAETAKTETEFNAVLLNLMNKAGSMAIPSTAVPEIEDSLKYNLDLSWFNDGILSAGVKTELDTIMARFREQDNYYVFSGGAGNPYFYRDTVFNQTSYISTIPSKEIRLDILFRYWNIINYFFPYKYQMDKNWDSTLIEFIPKFINIVDGDIFGYHRTVMELATRINDSHAFTTSGVINMIEGDDFPPFNIKFIENETVITQVQEGNTDFRVGDIIRRIDGVDITVLRDSLRKYTIGSNEPTINRNINNSILEGEYGFSSSTVENTDGTRIVNFNRGDGFSPPATPIWK